MFVETIVLITVFDLIIFAKCVYYRKYIKKNTNSIGELLKFFIDYPNEGNERFCSQLLGLIACIFIILYAVVVMIQDNKTM